jgi:hypothetical protein
LIAPDRVMMFLSDTLRIPELTVTNRGRLANAYRSASSETRD